MHVYNIVCVVIYGSGQKVTVLQWYIPRNMWECIRRTSCVIHWEHT